MADLFRTKLSLAKHLLDELNSKIEVAQVFIDQLQESKNSDTKSSAGDKHETGRAMAQIELENNQKQLLKLVNQRNDLAQVDLESPKTKVEFGSMVQTSMGVFFMAVGMGKLAFENQEFMVVSMASPIGQALIDKTSGEKAGFQSREIDILGIA